MATTNSIVKQEAAPALGYKGFDQDMKCRGFQFEVGKEYTHNGEIELCSRGFHYCENPLDVLGYYSADRSRFAIVEADGVSSKTDSDSKRVASKLKIKKEITLHSLVELGVKFILEKADFKNATELKMREHGAATNTGDCSAATNTGNGSAAISVGWMGMAANAGAEGCAVSLGIKGVAKGALGCWITLAEWVQIGYDWHRIDVQTAKIDGETIKADTWYYLKAGKFTEAE